MIIETARPEDWHAALACALGRVPDAERADRVQQCVQLLTHGILDPRGIFVAREGTIHAVQVCVPLAGAACLFWLPSSIQPIADALVDACLTWCRSQRFKVAQALAKADERPWTAPLVRQGFQPITRLQQLTHDLDELPLLSSVPLRIANYDAAIATAFAETLERTYDGTLDCPELNGARTVDDILAGHRGQGNYHPEFWWLAYLDDAPVGVVILSEMPDLLTWELAYLGLVPEARGRGFGRVLLLSAMHALRRARLCLTLALSVDERNVPARRLYRELGFHEVDCQDVFLYRW